MKPKEIHYRVHRQKRYMFTAEAQRAQRLEFFFVERTENKKVLYKASNCSLYTFLCELRASAVNYYENMAIRRRCINK